MKPHDIRTEELRTRSKFRCPIITNPTIANLYSQDCPISHPNFSQGKSYGCSKYLDITKDARSKIPRDSKLFKDTFYLRTEVERSFARLGNREVEQTTHYKLRSIQNQMTSSSLNESNSLCSCYPPKNARKN